MGGWSVTGSHKYAKPGAGYSVAVTIHDSGGAQASTTSVIKVKQVEPTERAFEGKARSGGPSPFCSTDEAARSHGSSPGHASSHLTIWAATVSPSSVGAKDGAITSKLCGASPMFRQAWC
jgi:hypothetical protein